MSSTSTKPKKSSSTSVSRSASPQPRSSEQLPEVSSASSVQAIAEHSAAVATSESTVALAHSVAEIAAVSAAQALHASPTVGVPPIAQSGVSSVRSPVLFVHSSPWVAPTIPIIRGNEDLGSVRSKLDSLLTALQSSFLRHSGSMPSSGEMGAAIFEAVSKREGNLQEWLYYKVTEEMPGLAAVRIPKAMEQGTLMQLISEARRLFAPDVSRAQRFHDWQAIRQSVNEPLVTFSTRWMEAFRRLDGYILEPGQAGATLYNALRVEARQLCGKQSEFVGASDELALEELLAVGAEEETKARMLQALMPKLAVSTPAPHALGGARPRTTAGAINLLGDSEAGGQQQRMFKCFLCGANGADGHAWAMCPDLPDAQAQARAAGLFRVPLPYRPQRAATGTSRGRERYRGERRGQSGHGANSGNRFTGGKKAERAEDEAKAVDLEEKTKAQ